MDVPRCRSPMPLGCKRLNVLGGSGLRMAIPDVGRTLRVNSSGA